MTSTATDTDGISSVKFYNGASLLGTGTYSAGTATYTYVWSPVAAGSYSLTAQATDTLGLVGSSSALPLVISNSPNQPPTVTMQTPAPGAVAPATVTLTATASDTDGTVTSVKFYNGSPGSGTLIGTGTNNAGTYSYSWTGVGAGSYTLYAIATDNAGATTTSNTVNLTVTGTNTPAVVTMTAPANNAVLAAGTTSVMLSADAVDPDGTIATMRFYKTVIDPITSVSSKVLIANATFSPTATSPNRYVLVWTGLAPGVYTVNARATDNTGAVTNTPTISFTISAPAPVYLPVVTLTIPADNATAAVGGAVTLTATATPRAGDTAPAAAITGVQFYDNGQLLGSGTAAGTQYMRSYSGLSAGVHIITARATNSGGAITWSNPATLKVGTGSAVSAPPTPPNLAGAVAGSLAGAASVSPTGAASYSVGVHVPPGTAGMAPTLSLNYVSQGGSGLMGVGWSIGGLSQITRCGKTIAQDGARKRVSLTSDDGYCLDGRRLILVSGTTNEYRTEVDAFSKIIANGGTAAAGPDTWTVRTKSAQVMTYGATSASANATIVASSQTSVKLTWLIAQTQDQRGNTVTYKYNRNTADGEFTPEVIVYTSNAGNAAATPPIPVLAPYNSIKFVYEAQPRPDPRIGYVAGAKLSVLKRLAAIRSYVNIGAGDIGTLARELRLTYVTNSTNGRSLVSAIADCDGQGNCLPATTFTWTQRSAADNTFNAAGSGLWGGPGMVVEFGTGTASDPIGKDKPTQLQAQIMMGDFNGDGKTDLARSDGSGTWQVCLSTGTGFNCQNWSGPAVKSKLTLAGDFNGDGKTDLAIRDASGNPAICYSTGSGFDCGPNTSGVTSLIPTSYIVGDFTGTGRDNLAWNTITTTTCTLLTASGYGFTCQDYAGLGIAFSGWSGIARPQPFVGNFNGDGRVNSAQWPGLDDSSNQGADLAAGWTIYTADNTGITTEMPVSPYQEQGRVKGLQKPAHGGSLIADQNADPYDSYADIFTASYYNSLQTGPLYKLSLCRSNGIAMECLPAPASAPVSDYAISTFADVDGDGRPDAIHFGDVGTIRVCQVGTGATFTYDCANWTGFAFQNTYSQTDWIWVGDFNGDGRADFAEYKEGPNGSPGQWYLHLAGTGTAPDLLASVTNGLGSRTSFTYSNLQNASVYVADQSSGQPTPSTQRDVQDGTTVVAKIELDNPVNGSLGTPLATSYRYGGLKADLQGRGSLGFRWIEATDSVSTVTTRTEYRQDFPNTGLVATQVASHPNGVVLRNASISYTIKTSATAAVSGQAIRFSYANLSTETSKDLDGSLLGTVTTTVPTNVNGYDIYGNLLSATVTNAASNGESFTTITTTTYQNNPGTWLIGLPSQIQVNKKLAGTPNTSNLTRTVAFTYDGYGSVATETVEPSNSIYTVTTTTGRDGFGNPLTKTRAWLDPVTATTTSRIDQTLTYDARGRYALTVQNALGHTETRSFDDAYGNLASLQGPNLLTTTWQYDGWGRKTVELRADGTQTQWAYRQCIDTCNGAASVLVTQSLTGTAPNLVQITPASETFADSLARTTQTRTWSFTGQPVLAEQVYDNKGRLQKHSRPHLSGAAPVWTSYVYDDLSRRTSITEAGTDGTSGTARISTVTYNGLNTITVNAKGQGRTETHNGQGKLKQVLDAFSNATSYQYDAFGNLTKVIDPLANTISMSYDLLGRKTQLKDPDLGTWNYLVDPLGRTYQQTDRKGQVTTYTFDALDRITRRLEADQDSTWTFDTGTKAIGKLSAAYVTAPGSSTKTYNRSHTYDSLGRAASTTITLDWDYLSTQSYDAAGRLAATSHSRNAIGTTSGLTAGAVNTVQYQYNDLGYLAQIRSVRAASTQSTLEWAALAQDAENRVTQELLGNGLVTNRSFNPYTGELQGIATGTATGSPTSNTAQVQNDTYQYDSLSNLTGRSQLADTPGTLPANSGVLLQETFAYDSLNRVTGAASTTTGPGGAGTTGSNSAAYAYNAIGNLMCNSRLSACTSASPNISYPASGPTSTRPHAATGVVGIVNGVTNPVYGYDLNGNQTSGAARTLVMTSFNLPASITYNHVALGQGANAGTTPAASSTAAFTYGPEHQRAKQTVTTNSGNPWVSERTITYAGAMEKETLPANSSNGTAALNPGSTRIKTYLPRNLVYLEELLPSANNPSANATPEQFTVAQADYTHTDHLGSISAITDQAGTLIERLSYDTFGLRRNADGSDDASQTLIGQQDRHGYTGHEHLDAVALIHMNGRLYDPQLGRFTSADPSIPDPDNPQNLNRYSYVLNNPLNATDPSGFSQLYIKVTLPYIDGPMWGGVILDAGTIGGLMGGWGLTGQTTTAEDEQKKIEEKNRERDQRESRCNRGGWSCVGDSGSSNYLTPEEQKAEAQKWLAGLESSKKNLEFAFGRKCQGDECVRNVLVALSMLPEVGTVFALTLAIWDKSWEEAALAVLPIRVPKVAGAAKEAGVVANGIRGRASEARVLNELGLTKNTTAVSTAEGRSIPDALTKSLSVEVKDAAKVSLTRQLRIQTEAARASGRESVLITGENTCVSGACSRAFDTIVRRPDLGPR